MELPDGFRLPENGAVDLFLELADVPGAPYGSVRVSSVAGPAAPWELRWSGPRVELGRVLAGEYLVRAELRVLETVDGDPRWTRPGASFEGTATVESGGRSHCKLDRE